MAEKEAYAGQADPSSGMSEYNRLDFMVRMATNRMRTMTVVQVMAVNGMALDVQPLVGQIDGAGNVTPHGIIHNIPYGQLQAGTNAFVIKPVVGDFGVVVFAQGDISTVVKTKKAGPPGSARKFDWSDAVYLCSIASMMGDPTQLVSIDDDGVTITSTGEVNIHAPDGLMIDGDATVDGDLAITGRFGANGADPQAKAMLPVALAPTAPTADIVAMVNAIRALLIANGQAE